MTIDFFNAELVEAYLNNQLSAEIKLRFDQNLKDNPEFSEFVSLYKDVDNAISESDVMDLRNSLNSIHKEVSEEWVDEAPMIVTDSFEEEIFDAIGEEDVMNLRASLNEIHDLNREELHLSDELAEVESMDMDELISLVDGDDDFFGDPELDKEIEMAIAEDDVMDLRNQLGAIAENEKVASKPTITRRIPVFRKMSKLSVAASIVLFISMGLTSYLAFSDGMSPDRIVDRLYEPIEAEVQRGGSIGDAQSDKQKAINIYGDKDHSGALVELFRFQANHPESRNDVDVILYIANSYFAMQQYDKAAEYFRTVYENKETARRQEAEWYLAGCFMNDESTRDRALEIYQQIARTPKHDYFDENEKLLKKLKK